MKPLLRALADTGVDPMSVVAHRQTKSFGRLSRMTWAAAIGISEAVLERQDDTSRVDVHVRRALSEAQFPGVSLAVGLTTKPRQLFEWSAKWLFPRVFKGLDLHVESVGEHEFSIRARLPHSVPDGSAFLTLFAYYIKHLPVLADLPEALVVAEIDSHSAVFGVTAPPAVRVHTRWLRPKRPVNEAWDVARKLHEERLNGSSEDSGLRQELDAARQELEEARATIARLAAVGRERDELGSQRLAASNDREELRAECDELRSGHDDLTTELVALAEERDELVSELETSRAEVQNVAAKRDALAQERDALERQIEEVMDDLGKVREDEEAARKERDALLSDHDALHEKSLSWEWERTSLAGELEDARRELEKMRTELEHAYRASAEFEAKAEREGRTSALLLDSARAELRPVMERLRALVPSSPRGDVDISALQFAVGELNFAISDVFDLARIERGEFKVSEARSIPAWALKGELEKASAGVFGEGTQVEVSVEEGVEHVTADAGRLRKSLFHLLGVAAHRAEDSVTLSLRSSGTGTGDDLLFDFSYRGPVAQLVGEGAEASREALRLRICEAFAQASGGRLEARAGIDGAHLVLSLPR